MFNESLMDTYEDSISIFFDFKIEPNISISNDNFLYQEYHYNHFHMNLKSFKEFSKSLKEYLEGPRFSKIKVLIDDNLDASGLFEDIVVYVLLVNKDFYNKMFKVSDIVWDKHYFS
jgi:hypothetical protein